MSETEAKVEEAPVEETKVQVEEVKSEAKVETKSQKFDLNKLIFHGGEEYEIVFTTSPKYRQVIKKNARLLKTPIIEIGYVTSGKGVFVQENNSYVRLKDLGWKHFR